MDKEDFFNLYEGTIIYIDIDEVRTIKSLPLAQKRASIYKKGVYLSREYAVKGPYNSKEAYIKRILQAERGLSALDEFYNIKTFEPIESILIYRPRPDSKIVEWEIWLRWNLIGNYDDMILVDSDPSKIEFTPFRYVKRRTFNRRVTDIEKDPLRFTPEIGTKVVLHLYFRYLLDIGGASTTNILYHNGEIYGIDFDSGRRVTFMTSKVPSKFNLLFGCSGTTRRSRLYEGFIANCTYIITIPDDLALKLRMAQFDVAEIQQRVAYYNFLLVD